MGGIKWEWCLNASKHIKVYNVYLVSTVDECVYYLYAMCTEEYLALGSSVAIKGSTIVYT